MEANQFVMKLWNDLCKENRMQKECILNEKQIRKVYENNRDDFRKILGIEQGQDVYDIFDNDQDGYLNEDDQILILSTIKEKMQRVGQQLRQLQMYEQFRELMKEVRKLEKFINKAQNELRQEIYKKEVDLYRKIGDQKMDDFYEFYSNRFKELGRNQSLRLVQIQQRQAQNRTQSQEKLQSDANWLKFKPNPKIKEYMINEQMVSLEERIDEAQNYKKELKKLMLKEQDRLNNVKQHDYWKNMDKIRKQQDFELKQLEQKCQVEENNLIIQMKKDYDIISKKKALYENEIKRIQGLSTKHALKVGEQFGELKRNKRKVETKEIILSRTKYMDNTMNQTVQGSYTMLNVNNTNDKQMSSNRFYDSHFGSRNAWNDGLKGDNYSQLKQMISSGDISKFYIRQDFSSDMPVNDKTSIKNQVDKHHKIEKYLVADSSQPQQQQVSSLCALYDQNMQLKKVDKEKERQFTEDQRQLMEKREYIKQIIKKDRINRKDNILIRK